jgi:hypothetical protein
MYGSNTVWQVGAGLIEQNSTYDMLGNVREWTESTFSGSTNITSFHAVRGGAYNSSASDLSADNSRWSVGPSGGNTSTTIGFRVAAIPEPGTMSLMGISTCALFITRRVRRRKLAGSSLMPISRRPNSCDIFDSNRETPQYVMDGTVEENDFMSILRQQVVAWSQAVWSWSYKQYKSADAKFWDRMIVVHENRVARSKAFRASFKKKTLAAFDAFLALIMK